jgi:Fe-S cluster assembly iron-binding protein IscA
MPQRFVGLKIPEVIAEIQWSSVGGGTQQRGVDRFGTEWRREEGYVWTTLNSEYRQTVFLPVHIDISADNDIEAVDVDAYISYGLCQGRPQDVEPQKRELHQVLRYLKSLFKSARRPVDTHRKRIPTRNASLSSGECFGAERLIGATPEALEFIKGFIAKQTSPIRGIRLRAEAGSMGLEFSSELVTSADTRGRVFNFEGLDIYVPDDEDTKKYLEGLTITYDSDRNGIAYSRTLRCPFCASTLIESDESAACLSSEQPACNHVRYIYIPELDFRTKFVEVNFHYCHAETEIEVSHMSAKQRLKFCTSGWRTKQESRNRQVLRRTDAGLTCHGVAMYTVLIGVEDVGKEESS